ncbi:hypothetical protein EVAR_86629_1 [Eumeta japonica]|uniref:Uncharacterized protein n=1 Tax=Eumeta variegata TaxID=151549 RepID=A0A4C1Z6P6_EUMVA|nr:hypothetical protein EVAR_86629_1 [Eumeta japonica]
MPSVTPEVHKGQRVPTKKKALRAFMSVYDPLGLVAPFMNTEARMYKPFVAHRLGEKDERTKIDEWKWQPSTLNMADDATRAHSGFELTNKDRCFKVFHVPITRYL